jgi:hypothetical protein
MHVDHTTGFAVFYGIVFRTATPGGGMLLTSQTEMKTSSNDCFLEPHLFSG